MINAQVHFSSSRKKEHQHIPWNSPQPGTYIPRLTNHSLHHTHHNAFPNQEQPLPLLPDLIDGEEHYKIEKVLNSRERKVRGKTGEPWRWTTDYFFKWKGYRPESNTWVRGKTTWTPMNSSMTISPKHVDMVKRQKGGLGVPHRSTDREETQKLGWALWTLGHIRRTWRLFNRH